MLCIRSPELIHLLVASCTPFSYRLNFRSSTSLTTLPSTLVSPALLFGHIQLTKITTSMNPTPYFLSASTPSIKHWLKRQTAGQVSSTTSSYKQSSWALKTTWLPYAALYPSRPLNINDFNSFASFASFWPSHNPSCSKWAYLLHHRENRSHQTWTLSISHY